MLDALSKSVPRKAKEAIREAIEAEVERVAERCADEFGTKWPKVVAKVVEDKEALVAFYEFRLNTGHTYAPPTPWIDVRTG